MRQTDSRPPLEDVAADRQGGGLEIFCKFAENQALELESSRFRGCNTCICNPQNWVLVSVSASFLLWLPVVVKYASTGHLGCDSDGCTHNVQGHIWQTFGHSLQGVITALLLIPWIKCDTVTRNRNALLGELGYNSVEFSEDHGNPPLHHISSTSQISSTLKNVASCIGLVTYPIYNLFKRWHTSNTVRHPASFWGSTFFLNQMVLAIALDLTLILASMTIYFIYGRRGVALLGNGRHLSCELDSFVYTSTCALVLLLGVTVACGVLSLL
mmetsp:Transcript_27039/g.47821  ORF Transcript_27039/g.47821 Transcript_27039/m.47821 type:complete len:270 (-) Transcript_27039:148-957(-)